MFMRFYYIFERWGSNSQKENCTKFFCCVYYEVILFNRSSGLAEYVAKADLDGIDM